MLKVIERFLLPNSCISCDALIAAHDPDALVCGVCASRMRTIGTGCPRCMHPRPPIGPCRFCIGWTEALVEIKSAVWLDRESRKIIHQLKYGHAHRLASFIVDIIVKVVPKPCVEAVVPVPVAEQRFRERGYNQAELIGAQLATRWNLPFLPKGLTRRQQATSQTALTPMKRAVNVALAFEARPTTGPDVGAHPVLIVDDVLTTGATVDACARALQLAGWKAIYAVTFARAKTYELQAVGY